MNNISWGKTMNNWGVNNSDFDPTVQVSVSREKKPKLSSTEVIKELEAIYEKQMELIKMSYALYNRFSNKDLSDSITSLESARKALESISVTPDPVEAEQEKSE